MKAEYSKQAMDAAKDYWFTQNPGTKLLPEYLEEVEVYASFFQPVIDEAFKAGLTKAADICLGHEDWMPADNEECRDAILSERDKTQ